MEIMWFKKIHTLSLFTCIGQNKGNKDLIRLLTEYSKEWPGFNLQCGAIIASMCYWNWECFIIMFIMQVWSIFTNWNREVGEQLLSCILCMFSFLFLSVGWTTPLFPTHEQFVLAANRYFVLHLILHVCSLSSLITAAWNKLVLELCKVYTLTTLTSFLPAVFNKEHITSYHQHSSIEYCWVITA